MFDGWISWQWNSLIEGEGGGGGIPSKNGYFSLSVSIVNALFSLLECDYYTSFSDLW